MERPRCLAFGLPIVPTGLISVMPQPCMTRMPKSSRNVCIIAGGTAAPPIVVTSSVENLRLFCFMYAIRPSQTVGTPADAVTRSLSNISYKLLPSSPAPGKTIFAPTSGAE